MKIEIDYLIKKRMTVECNVFDEAYKALLKTDWKHDGRIIQREPDVVAKVVTDDNIASYDSSSGMNVVKEEVIATKKKFLTDGSWIDEMQTRTKNLWKENPQWTEEKCKFIARKDMPTMPKLSYWRG